MSKSKQVKVIPYNTKWPEIFAIEAGIIKQALGTSCEAVHHIGSTSVPGLSAKEDIDILCVVDNLRNSLKLVNVGYVFKGELNIPLRNYFSKNTSESKVNLHVVEKDNGFIAYNLSFRDYLRSHSDTRLEYDALKRELAKNPENWQNATSQGVRIYTLKKHQFIEDVRAKTEFNELYVTYCLHYKEWEAYHRIREEMLFHDIEYDKDHESFRNPNCYHFVLYKGSNIVSVMMAELLNEDEIACRALATDTPYQNKGYGTYLMKFLERWTIVRGRKVIKLHAAIPAEQFYRELGYVDMEFDDPCRHEAHVDLGKILKAE
jgi:GrpB-like predicted nucleotidyltransferase (UPF0157 family)